MVTSSPIEVSLSPRIVRADEGHWHHGGPERFRKIVSSDDTDGAFMLVETQVDAPAYGPPYHVHTQEDETFIVIEGEMVLTVDGRRHTLRAGDVAFGPRGVPHTWQSGPNGVRFYIMANGSNFERAYGRILAAIDAGEPHRLPEIVGEHGISFVPTPWR